MTAPPASPVTFQADPTVLVYAVRWALGRRGSHAPMLVAGTVRENVKVLPSPARRVLVRDITGWLDGRGCDAPRVDREPWVLALAALGVSRRAVRVETPAPALLAPSLASGRRRADGRAAS